MHYKTIVLELLKQQPATYNQLRRQGTLLQVLELYAGGLKTSHEAWKEHFSQIMPSSSQSQITSEAMEMAPKELENFLRSGSSPELSHQPFLEGGVGFIRGRTPPA